MKRIIGLFFLLASVFMPWTVSAQSIVPNNSTAINVTATGNTTTQLVPSSGASIYVTSFNVLSTGTVTLEYGSGANCSTGTNALTGPYTFTPQTGGIVVGSGMGTVLKVASGNALCIVTTAPTAGSVSYQQF